MLQELFTFTKDRRFIIAFMTAVGAAGGFPTPPAFLVRLFEFKVVQYLAVAILVMQGGGAMDIKFSLKVVVLLFVVFEGIKYFEDKAAAA